MREPTPKSKPNALKHGVFSSAAILPGENLGEFTELLQSLVDEWNPSGALERETVMTLAECIWRKKRLEIFRKIQQAKVMCERGGDWQTFFTALERLVGSNENLKAELPKDDNVRFAIATNPVIEYLLRDTEAWNSVDQRVNYLWAKLGDALGVDKDRWEAWSIFSGQVAQLASLSDVLTIERYQTELALQERLEGMIDRCIKRLGHLKAMKRMLALEAKTKPLALAAADKLPPVAA